MISLLCEGDFKKITVIGEGHLVVQRHFLKTTKNELVVRLPAHDWKSTDCISGLNVLA